MQVSSIVPNTRGILVKYYGRDIPLLHNDPSIVRALQTTKSCISDIEKLFSKGPNWSQLKETLLYTAAYLTNPEITKKLYRIEILNEAVLPYIETMKRNNTLDQNRFMQITFLLDILSDNEERFLSPAIIANNGNNMTNTAQSTTDTMHPAIVCQHIDSLIHKINSTPHWFKSSLAKKLEAAVEKQWLPILTDNRRALQSFGVKAVALGLVEVLGRPAIMLYPIYMLLQQVLVIVRALETKQEISPQTILAIFKALLMLYLAGQFMTILAMYQGMGFAALLIGFLALATSVSDSSLKTVAPIISPHLAHVDALFDRIASIESVAFGAMRLGVPSSHININTTTATTGLNRDTSGMRPPPTSSVSEETILTDSSDVDADNNIYSSAEDVFTVTDTSTASMSDGGGLRRRTNTSTQPKQEKDSERATSSTWRFTQNR